MKEGLILTFNRKESEYGYPYTKIYNLVEVIIDDFQDYNLEKEYHYTLSTTTNEVKIHSSEEYYDFNDIVIPQIDKLDKLILYYSNDYGFVLYSILEKRIILIHERYQKFIKNELFELLSDKFLCN